MPLLCGSSTLRAKPLATAASIALPPLSNIRCPARAAREWPDATTPWVPMYTGRVVNGAGMDGSLVSRPQSLGICHLYTERARQTNDKWRRTQDGGSRRVGEIRLSRWARQECLAHPNSDL